MNLNESRKDRVVEGSNQHHAKALEERPTGGTGRPAPVANLCGPLADVQAWCTLFQVNRLGQFDEKCRLAGLVLATRLEFSSDSVQISLECWFWSPYLKSLCTRRKIRTGVWLAHTCAPTTRAQGGTTLYFYFIQKQGGVLLHTIEWTKWMK